MLLQAVEDMLMKMKAAAWTSVMTPKYHWFLHLVDQLALQGKLPSCFSVERKHKVLKKHASPVSNTTSFEKSCMQEILADELHHLQKADLFLVGPALVNPHVASKKLKQFVAETFQCQEGDVLTSAVAKLAKGYCQTHDVVLLGNPSSSLTAAQVWCFIQTPSFVGCLVNTLELKEYNAGTGSALWRNASHRCLVHLEDVVAPMFYCLMSNDIKTLMPWHLEKKVSIELYSLQHFLYMQPSKAHFKILGSF